MSSEVYIKDSQSVCTLKLSSSLDSDQRIQAVQAFRRLPEAKALAAASKWVSSILTKSGDEVSPSVDVSLLMEAAGKALGNVVASAESEVVPLTAARDYCAALARLTALREPVDTFFAGAMINIDDAAMHTNRYALLAKLRESFLGVANISLFG